MVRIRRNIEKKAKRKNEEREREMEGPLMAFGGNGWSKAHVVSCVTVQAYGGPRLFRRIFGHIILPLHMSRYLAASARTWIW